MQQIIDIASNFQLAQECTSVVLHRSGHIHNTYLLQTATPNFSKKYILQQVNQHVFPKVEQLSNNIRLVTEHIRCKAIGLGRDPSRASVTLISTHNGDFLYRDAEGSIWRVFEYIDNTRTYEVPQNGDQVYQAGRAIGDFICLLADFPASELFEIIPNFHHTPLRFANFQRTLDLDPAGRVRGTASEIEFVLSHQNELSKLVDMLDNQQLPLRVTHNDTKISNVLFDRHSGEAICMIDLDTVMPGTLLYDFGDAARTMTNTAAEDEPDLSKVAFNLEYFTQLARGFLERTSAILTNEELALLPFSAILMTLECGIRFLDDYLSGDVYFHTAREGHNLDRARVQFRLVEKMEENLDLMFEVIKDLNE